MRLSVDHAAICKTFGLEEGLRLIKSAGFDCIDYGFIVFDTKGTLFPDNFREELRYVARLLKEIGLGCDQTHAPIPVSYGPATIHFGEMLDMSNPHFTDMVYALEGSALLGATKCVFHGLAVPAGGSSEQYMEFNYAYFKALEPYAREFDVKIGIENLEKISGNLYEAEWQNELLNRLDSPYFYALVDMGHAAASETTPDKHLRAIEKGRVQGLHFHDFNTMDAHIVPGLGITDWDKVAITLAEIGYSGDLSMEVVTHRLFPKTVIPTALKFTAESGRAFIRKFEKARAELC